MNEREALLMAVKAIGGYAATARLLGFKTAWAVQKWVRCPAEKVCALVALSREIVTPSQLRPDIYPANFRFPAEMLEAALSALTALKEAAA